MRISLPEAHRKHYFSPDSGVDWWNCGSTLSACDSVEHPFDVDVVREIRKMDPGFVPLVRTTILQDGHGNYHTWEHHAWFRVLPVADETLEWRRIRKPILWPCNPKHVNYKFADKADRLVFVRDVGFVGNSEFKPGRFRPIDWWQFKKIALGYGYTSAVGHKDHARMQLEADMSSDARNTAEADDLISYAYDSNQRRFDGNPLVSVPGSYGDAA